MAEQGHPRPKRVTRQDVARYAGVSTAVVSYVINDVPGKAAPATQARVREAIEVLGYRPDANARALRMGSARLLGVIVPDTANPFFAELTDALAQSAAAHGYDVLVANSGLAAERERRNAQNLISRQVDGLIIATLLSPAEQAALPTGGIRRVLIAQSATVPGIPAVSTDFRSGAQQGVEHLIAHGHRSIGLIVGGAGDDAWRDPREDGWAKALHAAGLPLGPVERTNYTRQGGYEAARAMLASSTPPTAIFASSDIEAIGALRAIHEADIAIPDDIALVAFDGTIESEFSWPQLTVVKQSVTAVADAATEAALFPERVKHELQLIPTELLIRRSCGC
ncbi:LacI family DNA-binding transcriptional regulator [Nonomuraea sp. NPDC059194]|uniref:LacI family DNA-binding transcriptional regulator n=1 Tax=Nonomuraea sp. NPDC059194 TaxID=3346764 RepID=UPI0036BD3AF3